MIEKYEQAIKETFNELHNLLEERHQKALNDPEWKAWELGLDRKYVITSRMARKGFKVTVKYGNSNEYFVFPPKDNLPIHIWRDDYVY